MLRGHPSLTDLSAREALDTICRASERFTVTGGDPWTDYLGFSDVDQIEFLTTWDKIKYPAGVDFLEMAVARAKTHPLVPESVGTRRIPEYEEFISIAGHLQVFVGLKSNILLPCEKLAEILGVDASTVSRYRQLVVMDGYLEEVVPYRWVSSGNTKATEFRFRIDRFPELQEAHFPETDGTNEEEEES